MSGIPRRLFERLGDHPLHVIIADGSRSSGARLVGQAIQAPLHESAPPLAHRLRRHAKSPADLAVVVPLCAVQDDATAECQCLRRLASS
jgi:hypothetical protein